MNNLEYQQNELKSFYNQKNCYFDDVNDFIEYLDNTDIYEQIKWIENGTYGAGACFCLQKIFNYVKENNRVNKTAHVGNVVLKCFWGQEFKYWNKLPDKTKNAMNKAVNKWIKSRKQFAQILEV